MAMDAIVATIVDGGRAIDDIDKEASRNKLTSHLIYNFILNTLTAASYNPFCRGSRGCGMFVHQNHAAVGGNDSSWWGYL
jgi:hypothetical protein